MKSRATTKPRVKFVRVERSVDYDSFRNAQARVAQQFIGCEYETCTDVRGVELLRARAGINIKAAPRSRNDGRGLAHAFRD